MLTFKLHCKWIRHKRDTVQNMKMIRNDQQYTAHFIIMIRKRHNGWFNEGTKGHICSMCENYFSASSIIQKTIWMNIVRIAGQKAKKLCISRLTFWINEPRRDVAFEVSCKVGNDSVGEFFSSMVCFLVDNFWKSAFSLVSYHFPFQKTIVEKYTNIDHQQLLVFLRIIP